MLAILKKWPKWLSVLSIILATIWLLRILPTLLSAISCFVPGVTAVDSCGTLWLGVLFSAVESALLIGAGWLVFYVLAFEGKRASHEWKSWLWVGLWFAIATTFLGAALAERLFTTDAMGAGATPPGLLSAEFLFFLCTLFLFGFLLGLWFAFPIHWALRTNRNHRLSLATKGAILGGAIGFPYSILSLVVVPFVSVFGVFAQWFEITPGSIGYYLGLIQPLMFFLLPSGVLRDSPFSPVFDPSAGPASQALGLPLFLIFNTVGNILILLIVGWVVGWVVSKVKKIRKAR